MLLTESAFLAARNDLAAGQRFGWWCCANGKVGGASIQAPRHAPVLSRTAADAVEPLAVLSSDATAINVDSRLAATISAAWRSHACTIPIERSRITLFRLDSLKPLPQPPRGKPRTAGLADRVLLVSWYEQMMSAFPADPSEVSYVVDDPLTEGGITLWEIDGQPVAMAGRARPSHARRQRTSFRMPSF